jgi:hypothetical protein
MRNKGRGSRTPGPVRATALAAALLLASAFILAPGCGIQSFPYLAPVKDEDIDEPFDANEPFKFFNNTDNDPTYFYGYEIYYKFYSTADGSVFETEEQTLIDGASLSQATSTLGFRRLVENGDAVTKPLIYVEPVNRNSRFQNAIDFSQVSDGSFPSISYNAESFQAARYVEGPGGIIGYYSFSPDELTEIYDDITSDMLTGSDIRLAFIVFTYGKQNIYQDLYSLEAAYLGSVVIATP